MTNEIIDIVNEHDSIIGTETLPIAHEQKLLHRSSTVLVFKDESKREILLQKRSEYVKNKPGTYCTPGGHVQQEQTYEEAGRREFCEEMLSIADDPSLQMNQLFKLRKNTDDDPEFLMVYSLIHPGPFTVDSKEVSKAQFMSLESLYKKIETQPSFFNETTILVLQEYKKRYLK